MQQEILEAEEEVAAEDVESNLILQRARALAKQHPEQAEDFLAFANNQHHQVEFMRKHFAAAIWLLQRT